jgi:cysteinyl-tRNA synthetase
MAAPEESIHAPAPPAVPSAARQLVRRLQWLVERGAAYQLDTEVGSFLVAEAGRIATRCAPVLYPIVQQHGRGRGDFALWAPYVDGRPSPWGAGLPTANVHLLVDDD